MTYVTKQNNVWVERTPKQFRNELNASIPNSMLESMGLFQLREDPKPNTPGKIAELGSIVEREGKPFNTWVERNPTPEETTQIEKQAFQEINQERERRLAVGSAFSVTALTTPILLNGRPFDQTVYLALLARAQRYKVASVTDPVLRLRDGADVIHMLTPDQMIELVSQAMTWVEQIMSRSWAMKDGTSPFETGIPVNITADEHWTVP